MSSALVSPSHPSRKHGLTHGQAVSVILRNIRRQPEDIRERWKTRRNDSVPRQEAKYIIVNNWLERALLDKKS